MLTRTGPSYGLSAEDTLVVPRLPAFGSRFCVRERRHPKLFWVDAGLVRAAKRQLGSVGAEERGALFEGWVLTVLRAHHAKPGRSSKISVPLLCHYREGLITPLPSTSPPANVSYR